MVMLPALQLSLVVGVVLVVAVVVGRSRPGPVTGRTTITAVIDHCSQKESSHRGTRCEEYTVVFNSEKVRADRCWQTKVDLLHPEDKSHNVVGEVQPVAQRLEFLTRMTVSKDQHRFSIHTHIGLDDGRGAR